MAVYLQRRSEPIALPLNEVRTQTFDRGQKPTLIATYVQDGSEQHGPDARGGRTLRKLRVST